MVILKIPLQFFVHSSVGQKDLVINLTMTSSLFLLTYQPKCAINSRDAVRNLSLLGIHPFNRRVN